MVQSRLTRPSWTQLHAFTSPRCQRRRAACVQCLALRIAVVGGGAAGLTAAYFASGASGAEVVVLESNTEAGKKILISGGTRCNVLPVAIELQQDFVTESSQSALRAVFASWTLEECLDWLSSGEHIGIPLAVEEETQKYFPASNSAQQVRDRLVAACQRRGVEMRYGARMEGLRRLETGGWAVDLACGGQLVADRVVLATGGKSFPMLGTTGAGYAVAEALGHSLQQPYPALTPLLGRHPGGQQLAGVSLYSVQLTCKPAEAAASGAKKRRRAAAVTAQRSAMLFTHRGFSGPAVLDLSHHVVRALERGEPLPELLVDWTGEGQGAWEARLSGGGSGLVPGLLRRHGLPQRLAEALCAEARVPLDRKLAELKKGEREALLVALTCYPLVITGHEGYPKAEVTGGGVPLNEVDCATLESRRAPGLHLCGEVLDVFGRIGGFNFAWAWWTGRLAGAAAARLGAGAAGAAASASP